MSGGFSFDGLDIAELGQEYVPEQQNTYVYGPESWKMSEESFDAHDGGYVYGATVQPKDFALRCIFQIPQDLYETHGYETTNINNGILTRISRHFRRGKTARLVFDRRPWCWYGATVIGVEFSQITNYLNGFVTIRLRAYYPFARSDSSYYSRFDNYSNSIIGNSAMLEDVEWDLAKDFAETNPITEQTTFLLFNPGTENAAVSIELAGDVGEGITIANANTNQKCEVVGLTSSITASKYLILDSLSGKVLLTDGTTTEYGFLYHDNGFIDLASNYPIIRNIAASGTSGTNTVRSVVELPSDVVGQYFAMKTSEGADRLNNSADGLMFVSKIVGIDEYGTAITLQDTLPEAPNYQSMIGTFNLVTVTPKSTMNLTKLVFRYKPTFE